MACFAVSKPTRECRRVTFVFVPENSLAEENQCAYIRKCRAFSEVK
jgi:hypothetical protein